METKRPDAIVTDLDGTLLGPDKQVGERDAAAIRRLTRLGIPVVPGTGRPIFGIGPLMEELGPNTASNGPDINVSGQFKHIKKKLCSGQ